MSTIKNSNSRDLVDAEEIKKRWKEYMEKLYKKDLNELDYYDGMVSHPELDILECEVKWTLRSTAINKASGYHETSAELFKSLTDDAIKVLYSICQQIRKMRGGHRTGKGQSLSQFPRRLVAKNVLTIGLVQLLATPWTAAYQAPPTMGFSRQEYWSGMSLPSLKTFISGVI